MDTLLEKKISFAAKILFDTSSYAELKINELLKPEGITLDMFTLSHSFSSGIYSDLDLRIFNKAWNVFYSKIDSFDLSDIFFQDGKDIKILINDLKSIL